MPTTNNPLVIAAHQYLKGNYSREMDQFELDSLSGSLLSGVKDQMAFTRVFIHRIDRMMEELAANGLVSGDENCRNYCRLFTPLLRSTRHLNRLERIRIKINDQRNADLSIGLASLELTPDESDQGPFNLAEGYIRSSTEINIFYSKLFRKTMDLTRRQWKLIEPLIPTQGGEGAGRLPLRCRKVLNGIFWKLRTGASWDDLPPDYPSHQTCYRYFTKWMKDGTIERILYRLLIDLKENGLDINQALHNSDIEVVRVARRTLISFAPRLVDTWQGSTALLLVQVGLAKSRKNGSSIPKPVPVYKSTLDALRDFNTETEGN